MQKNTLKLVRAGVIAGLYIVLSLVTLSVSGGAIQIRASEGLTLLPLLLPEAVPALFVGCLLFNFISGLALYDVVLGSLVTLVAGVLTYLVGKIIKNKWVKIIVGGLFPVLLNALLLPVFWYYFAGELEYVYLLSVAFLTISQSVSVYAVGILIYLSLEKLKDKNLGFLE